MKFLKLVENKELCWTVVAPTHKAVGVLRLALEGQGLSPTWYASTIHRLLRLKLKRKGYIEICEKTDQTSQSLDQLDLVLIDEASMVDSTLLAILLECAHCGQTRLVFVGDPAQLPPIGESESSVFSMQRATHAELNEVVRHQGPVLELASRIRDGRLQCKALPCMPIVKTKLGTVGSLAYIDWLNKAKESLRLAASNDKPDASRILCYTNRSLENLVPHARRAIHGEMADQLPVLPGEVLITRMAVMAPACRDGSDGGEEPDMVLGSNREIVVRDVLPESFNLAELGFIDGEYDLPIIDTQVVEVVSGELNLSLRLLPPIGTNSRKLLDRTLKRLRVQASESNKNLGRLIWKSFFLIRDSFASVGPASVLTVHRSQGSTFGEVFISSDIFWPKDFIFRKQLAYVAITRASHAVWIVGDEKSCIENINLMD